MSWPTWSAAAPPMPAAVAPVQSALLPTAINSAPTVIPPNLAQYTPEQWAQAQQNWQQWAQWQQQYQQWHQQYGAEYQKSLALQAAVAQPPLPTPGIATMAPPLPVESKPPLPPEEPPNIMSYSTAPPKPVQTGYSTAPPLITTQHTQPPPQVADPYNQRQSWQNTQKRPYGTDTEYEPAKKPNIDKGPTKWAGQKQASQNQWEGGNQNFSQPPPQAQSQTAAASTSKNVNVEELSEAEKKFDKEFAAWEAQFNKWKEQNANHPDKAQYREYEKKWESWRNSLLERREQMRRKRLSLAAGKQQPAANFSQPPPATNTSTPGPQNFPTGVQNQASGSSQVSSTANQYQMPPPNQNNEPLAFKPGNLKPDDANIGAGFLGPSSASAGGIPGLDLVKEDLKEQEVEIQKGDVIELEKDDKPPPQQSGPDLDAISKGINNILGDQKLLSMLSMVTQNPPPTVGQNLSNQTYGQIRPNYNAPPPTDAPFGNMSVPPPSTGPYSAPPPNISSFNEQSNQSYEEKSNQEDFYREDINNFDDQTRSSFTLGPNDHDQAFRNRGTRFTGDRINNFGPGGSRINVGPTGQRNDNFGVGAPRNENFGAGAPRNDVFGSGTPRNDNFGPGGPRNENFGPGGLKSESTGPGNLRKDSFGPGGPRNDSFGPGSVRNDNFGPRGSRNDNFGINAGRSDNFGPGGPRNDNFGSGGARNDNFGSGGPRNENFGAAGSRNFASAGLRNNMADNFGPGGRNNFGRDNDRFGPNRGNSHNDRFTSKDDFEENYDQENTRFGNFRNNKFDNAKGNFNQRDDNRNFNRSDDFKKGDYDDLDYNEDEDYDKYHEMFNEDEQDYDQDYNQDYNQKYSENRNKSFNDDYRNQDYQGRNQAQGFQNKDFQHNRLPPKNESGQQQISPHQQQIPPHQQQIPPHQQQIPHHKPPPLMETIIPQPPELQEQPVEEEVTAIFEPATVIDYEHKSQKKNDFEVTVVPAHMFDYRHKPLNRIPLPQRPNWLSECVRFIREFDPMAARMFDRPIERIERFPPARNRSYEEPDRMMYDERDRFERGERFQRDDRFEKDNRFDNEGRFEKDDRNDRNFSRNDFGDGNRDRRRSSDHDDRFDRRRNTDDKTSRNFEKRSLDGKDSKLDIKESLEDLSEDEMDWEAGERNKFEKKSRSPSPLMSNPPNPSTSVKEITTIDDIINPPGRFSRPPRIVIILRGPPGSGKTHLAKLIKDKEVENGGSAPRILSLDDYFLAEHEKQVVEDGKTVTVKEMVYEYEAEMEESYRNSFTKSFKKTITDGYFPFIIVDNINDKVKYFGEMWSFAKQNGFQVYICQMDLDPVLCTKRNVHNRTEAEIEDCIAGWEPTPTHHPTIDASGFLQANTIMEVEMEVVEQKPPEEEETEKTPEPSSMESTNQSENPKPWKNTFNWKNNGNPRNLPNRGRRGFGGPTWRSRGNWRR